MWQTVERWTIKLGQIGRPQIALQAAAYTAVGVHLSGGATSVDGALVGQAALVVALIVAFGFAINDLVDIDLDRLTKPERPLPAGLLSVDEARIAAMVFAGAAVALASPLPPTLLGLALLNIALTAAYSLYLKPTVLVGNLTIAWLNSSILIFGALAAQGVRPLVWAVAGMALVYTLAQEVLYTIDDREGDCAAGLVTTAVALGVTPALWLVQALLALAALIALVPLWLVPSSPLYAIALLLCTVGPIVLGVMPLVSAGTPASVRRACERVKLIRFASLLPLVLLPVG